MHDSNIRTPLDAWPIGKRLDHIIQHLEVDEWRNINTMRSPPPPLPPPNTIKDSKLEKLEVLIRILKNTTGIEAHYPKQKLISR